MSDELKTGLGWFFIWIGLSLGIGGCTYLQYVGIGKCEKLKAEAKLLEAQAKEIRNNVRDKPTKGNENGRGN
jgi:hypothetical protein